MSKDSAYGIVGIFIIVVGLLIAIRFLGAILGFLFENLWISIALAIVVSMGAAAYFGSKKSE